MANLHSNLLYVTVHHFTKLQANNGYAVQAYHKTFQCSMKRATNGRARPF